LPLLSIIRCNLGNGIFCCFTRLKISFWRCMTATSKMLCPSSLSCSIAWGCCYIISPTISSIPYLVAINNGISSFLLNDDFVKEFLAVERSSISFP
jgi:hypothetical protein